MHALGQDSDGAGNAQVPDLLQDLLDTGVELALGILVSCVGVEVLLDLGHARVGLCAEAQLDFDEGLEAGVEVGDAQVDELGQLAGQGLVELVVGSLGKLLVLFGARQLGDVLVGLVGQLLDLGAHAVVVHLLVLALGDAGVDVGKVAAEALDGVEDGGAVGPVEGLDGLGVEVGDGLLVGARHAVLGAGVAVEGVDGLGDAHLRGRHGAQRVEVALGLLLQLVSRRLHGAVAPLLRLEVAVVGALDLARLHEHLRRGAVDALFEARPRHVGAVGLVDVRVCAVAGGSICAAVCCCWWFD